MRPEKKSIVDQIHREVEEAVFVLLTDYQGLNVAQTEDLRCRLDKVNAHFRVVKNRMLRHVVRDLSYDAMEPSLRGPSAMVVGNGDVVEVAKILRDFVKENQLPVVKVGALEGVVLSAEDIQRLAELPPKPVMQAMLVGTIAAPLRNLVGVCHQKLSSLVYVLKAIEDKKGKN